MTEIKIEENHRRKSRQLAREEEERGDLSFSVVNVHVSSDSVTEQRGGADLRVTYR